MQLALDRPTTIREKDASIQLFDEARPTARRHLLVPILEPLFGIFVLYRPLGLLSASDAEQGGEHVFLADVEAGDEDELVPETVECQTLVVFVFGQDGQAEKLRDGEAAERPCRGVDFGVAVVVECGFAVVKVKAKGPFEGAQAVLVPEVARQAHPAHGGLGIDVLTHFFRERADQIVPLHLFLVGIGAVVIGHDPGYAGGLSGINELDFRSRWSHDGHGDDQSIVTF